MSKNVQLECTSLLLDLRNYRTTPQRNEHNAVKAMISIKPDKFFALMDNILDEGYSHTENIIVLETPKGNVVKEGNRRIAILKILHGKFKINDLGIPTSILGKIQSLTPEWLKENLKVSCIVFSPKEADKADKIVALTHAKGEKAGRDKWTSVATARHNRDVNKKAEPILDLLEKYLANGKNLTMQQKERWAGDYNLSVLVEAISKILPRLEIANAAALVTKYPKIKFRANLEEIIRDIGLEQLNFTIIRNINNDFAEGYGFPSPQSTQPQPQTATSGANETAGGSNSRSATPQADATRGPKAVATNDPKHIANLLKKFNPRGKNREKVVTLRNELQKIKIASSPIAFCFILRSMFEISAKAYCTDHSISMVKTGGKDKTLVEVLSAITNHLTANNTNKAMAKILHGAMADIGTPNRLLSVTSMNQLVHNPSFSFIPNDICTLFGNIYPLLEAMN